VDKQADAHAGRSPAAGQTRNPVLVSILQISSGEGGRPGARQGIFAEEDSILYKRKAGRALLCLGKTMHARPAVTSSGSQL
jgi:hypothetical protein